MKKVGVKDMFKEAGRCYNCGKKGPIVVGLGSKKYCASCKHLAAPSPRPSSTQPDGGRARNIRSLGERRDVKGPGSV